MLSARTCKDSRRRRSQSRLRSGIVSSVKKVASSLRRQLMGMHEYCVVFIPTHKPLSHVRQPVHPVSVVCVNIFLDVYLCVCLSV